MDYKDGKSASVTKDTLSQESISKSLNDLMIVNLEDSFERIKKPSTLRSIPRTARPSGALVSLV